MLPVLPEGPWQTQAIRGQSALLPHSEAEERRAQTHRPAKRRVGQRIAIFRNSEEGRADHPSRAILAPTVSKPGEMGVTERLVQPTPCRSDVC
jgi:hypothetical protein